MPLTAEQSQGISELIQTIIEKMGVACRVSVEENIKGTIFNISSPDSNLLIGQKGNNLHALQTLVQSLAFKRYGMLERFFLDVDDYKKKREWYLRETAKKALEQIKRTHRPIVLEPMPPYERRVVHAYLSQEYDIETESIGEEPNRRIVIKPKAKGSI